jgi:hypothetical protein
MSTGAQMAEARKTRPVSWIKAVQLAAEIRVIHAFQKKSKQGIQTPKHEIDVVKASFENTEGGTQMKSEKLELVRGSGNVFRELGRENADVEQLKAASGGGNHQDVASG